MTDRAGMNHDGDAFVIDDRELSAFLDGEIEEARRREIAEAIALEPLLARRAEALRLVDRAVVRFADAVAEAALPNRLCVRRLAAERRAKAGRRLVLAGVAALLLLAGAAGGWIGHGLFHSQTFWTRNFVEHAAAAHKVYTPEVRRPVEVAASERQAMLVWLSKRLAQPVAAPDLASVGFELAGGRVLPGRGGQPAAQVMYVGRDGRRLTLYVMAGPRAETASFRFFRPDYGEAETVYWIERKAAYAVTGPFDRETLLAAARAILQGMDGA